MKRQFSYIQIEGDTNVTETEAIRKKSTDKPIAENDALTIIDTENSESINKNGENIRMSINLTYVVFIWA